jgi:hypothetical protein
MDFATMFQTWLDVLSKPEESTFREQHEKADLGTAFIWIGVATVVATVLQVFSAVMFSLIGFGNNQMMQQMLQNADLPPEVAAQFAATGDSGVLAVATMACFGTLIGVPLGFLFSTGIYFLVAKLLGGTGSFEAQTYLLAAIVAPMTIITSFLGFIPFLGGCLSFVLVIYQLVLFYFAIKVAHNFDSTKTVMVILIPVIVVFLCICAFGASIGFLVTMAGAA